MIRSLRIVAADDDSAVLALLGPLLAKLGHELVCTACNGRELVQKCKDSSPDLIMTDYQMPELDGLTAAGELAALMRLPIILMSAHYTREEFEPLNCSHISAFLAKPFTVVALEAAIVAATTKALNQGAPLRP